MKKFSDYKGEEAIELWADILEPASAILGDERVAQMWQNKTSPLIMAQQILKIHKKEAMEIVLRIDDTPINGLNIITRIVDVILEFANSPELKDFLSLQGQGISNVSFGSVTENTGANETPTDSDNTSKQESSKKNEG